MAFKTPALVEEDLILIPLVNKASSGDPRASKTWAKLSSSAVNFLSLWTWPKESAPVTSRSNRQPRLKTSALEFKDAPNVTTGALSDGD